MVAETIANSRCGDPPRDGQAEWAWFIGGGAWGHRPPNDGVGGHHALSPPNSDTSGL